MKWLRNRLKNVFTSILIEVNDFHFLMQSKLLNNKIKNESQELLGLDSYFDENLKVKVRLLPAKFR